jgi:hypothetical protein
MLYIWFSNMCKGHPLPILIVQSLFVMQIFFRVSTAMEEDQALMEI